MNAARDLKAGWRLPADSVPWRLDENVLRALRRELVELDDLRRGRFQHAAPAWVGVREADAWLELGDRASVAFVWRAGELAATIYLNRDKLRRARRSRRSHELDRRRRRRRAAGG